MKSVFASLFGAVIILAVSVDALAQESVSVKGRLLEIKNQSLRIDNDVVNVGDCEITLQKSYDVRQDGLQINGVREKNAYLRVSMKADVRKARLKNEELGVSFDSLYFLFGTKLAAKNETVSLRNETDPEFMIEFENAESLVALMADPKILSLKKYKGTWHGGYFAGSDRYKWAYACVAYESL